MAFEYTIIREFNKEREKLRREAITEGKMEGRMEGRIEGKREAVLELLEDLGEIPEGLEQKIREQKDLNILKKWHKLAASVSEIEMFEEKIANEILC